MPKENKSRDDLLIENHDLKKLYKRLAHKYCQDMGEGYYETINFDKTIIFHSLNYGVVSILMNDTWLKTDQSIYGKYTTDNLNKAYEKSF